MHKRRVGFQRQLVHGQVGWRITECDTDVSACLVDVLAGQAEHEIDVITVEATVSDCFERCPRLFAVMNPPQRFQLAVAEALNTD